MDDRADTTLFMERQQFFNGQRLFAADLQELEAFHRGMRELHNRSLHQAGIGNGFAVTGPVGDREVGIGPGYALDSEGHEIVLTATHTEQVPPVSAEEDGESVYYDLTVSYPPDEELEEAETRDGVCLRRGVVRLEVEPIFCWVRLERDERDNLHARDQKLKDDIQQGRKIRLARVEIKDCMIKSRSVEERRNARPTARPYIACGRAEPQWTAKPGAFLCTRVDTTCAGFSTVPCYTAHLEGPRFSGLQTAELLVGGMLSIFDPQVDSFQIALPIQRDILEGESFEIVWMGVE